MCWRPTWSAVKGPGSCGGLNENLMRTMFIPLVSISPDFKDCTGLLLKRVPLSNLFTIQMENECIDICSWCLMVTLLSDMMFVLHSSYRLFCCRLHHVGSACGWTRPDYCDYCSSHQSSRWENSHQHLFGLMNTKCQFTAEMLLCALFPREPETSEAFRCSSQSSKDQIRQEHNCNCMRWCTQIFLFLVFNVGQWCESVSEWQFVCVVSQVDHDEDEDDGVVKYENCGDTSASVRLHWSTTSTSTSSHQRKDSTAVK